MRLIWIVTSLVLFLFGTAFFIFVQLSNPIQVDGVFTTTYEEGKKEIVFEISNEGFQKIKIKKVLINTNKQLEGLSLGISYDGQLVQSGTDNPLIKFMKIDSEYIRPKLSQKEFNDAMKRRDMTPIHYGIRVGMNEEVIKSMTLKYSYFGIPVKKTISLERWNIGNE